MAYISSLILGFMFGIVITIIVVMNRTANGILKIDHSNPEKDVYRIELGDLDELSKKKTVILTVDNDADLSQK